MTYGIYAKTRRAPYHMDRGSRQRLDVRVGFLLSSGGLAALVTPAALHGDARRVVSFSIYGASLIALFRASTLYHAVQSPLIKRIFGIIDQSAIYLPIAWHLFVLGGSICHYVAIRFYVRPG